MSQSLRRIVFGQHAPNDAYPFEGDEMREDDLVLAEFFEDLDEWRGDAP